MNQKKEICEHCGGVIFLKKSRYVTLQTNQGEDIIEQKFYHIQCWVKFWNEKVQEAIMKRAKKGMDGFMKALPLLQKELKNFKYDG